MLAKRIAVAIMAMSASAFIALVSVEDYTSTAIIPTKNDRPTKGFGSTFNADGTPVRMGDTTTPVRALILAQAHISKEEQRFRATLPGVELHQAEYDIYMDWVYQYGAGAWGGSSMHRELVAGNYVPACRALLKYRFSGGFDCALPGNKVCAGVWTRQQERFKKCMGAQ